MPTTCLTHILCYAIPFLLPIWFLLLPVPAYCPSSLSLHFLPLPIYTYYHYLPPPHTITTTHSPLLSLIYLLHFLGTDRTGQYYFPIIALLVLNRKQLLKSSSPPSILSLLTIPHHCAHPPIRTSAAAWPPRLICSSVWVEEGGRGPFLPSHTQNKRVCSQAISMCIMQAPAACTPVSVCQ